MKNQLLLLALSLLFLTPCFAQQKITIIKPASGKTLTFKATIDDKNVEIRSLNTKENIQISPDPSLTNVDYIVKVDNVDVTSSLIPDKKKGMIIATDKKKVISLIVKAKGYDKLQIDEIGKDFSSKNEESPSVNENKKALKAVRAKDYLLNYFTPSQFSFHDLKTLITTGRRYYPGRDEAFIILDENGRLIGNVPVNLDQDDKVFFYLVVDKADIDLYELEVIGGEYSPVDLQIRTYEPINKEEFSTQGAKQPKSWTVIRFERGPYTSDNVTFNIKKSDNDGNETKSTTLSTYTLKFNKLFHVAIGGSFVTTNLANPSYNVFPLSDSTNTISTINNGSRTMFTFNVIWYWANTFKYFRNGSELTRGRDVLKEPNWITRLNPTFGVTIDNTFKENFFIGGTYEFARGGSVCFGGHYGKVNDLATRASDGSEFILGESVFTGTKDDIILSDKWDWGFFVGITLDTRIFNKVLARN